MTETEVPIEPFEERYQRAIADDQLHVNLLNFQRRWVQGREAGLQGIDFPAARSRLTSIKTDVVAHLPEYLETFTRNAEAAGATVVRAEDAASAVAYIADLAERRGVRHVVKSKSMVSE